MLTDHLHVQHILCVSSATRTPCQSSWTSVTPTNSFPLQPSLWHAIKIRSALKKKCLISTFIYACNYVIQGKGRGG